MGALARDDGAAVLALARELADKLGAVRDDWNGFAVLHTAAARVGGLDLGLVPGEGGRDVGRHPGRLREAARSTWSICWPPTRSTPSGSARPS